MVRLDLPGEPEGERAQDHDDTDTLHRTVKALYDYEAQSGGWILSFDL